MMAGGDCPSAVLAGALPPALFAQLDGQFRRVLESDYEPPYKEDSLTFGTFWVDLSRAPRNAIEAAAVVICRSAAFRELVDADRLAGAEWWWQEQVRPSLPPAEHPDCPWLTISVC